MWYYYFVVFSALIGVIVGSFANVLIVRHGTGLGVGGRSRCMACKATLTTSDLVPIVSYLRTGGRCRHCGSRFSWHYPAIEVLGGVYAAVLVLAGLRGVELALFAAAAVPLLVIVGYDLTHSIIPPSFARMLAVLAFAHFALDPQYATLVAALAFMLFFYCIWLFSDGRAMGFGDVGLVFSLALLFGYPVSLIGTIFAFWIGAAVGILLLFSPALGLTLKSEVPFGPFLVIGYILSLAVVQNIIGVLGVFSVYL